MENPKKIAIVFAALWLCCCGKELPRSNHAKSANDSIAISTLAESSLIDTQSHSRLQPLGKGLFADSANRLFLKVINRESRHPSSSGQSRPDSLLLEFVFDSRKDSLVPLSSILDRGSFSMENPSGNYFSDSSQIYIYTSWPYPHQFFILPRANERFLGASKDYLLHNGVLYYQGTKIEGVDASKSKIVRYRKVGLDGYHEFLTDGERLYDGLYPLDEERLGFVENLSESDIRSIRKRFLAR